jgi:hypothetical protein
MAAPDNNLTPDQVKLNAFIVKFVWTYCTYTHFKELFKGKESDLKLSEKNFH